MSSLRWTAAERPGTRAWVALAWLALGFWILGSTLVLGCMPTVGGIHARMGYSESGGLRVVDVPEGPARRAGLREGDRIASIDGDPVRSMALEEVVERLRGPIGSEVEVEVVREGELVTLLIARAPYEE